MADIKKTIMIVEDDKFLQGLTEREFKKKGFEVLLASEGGEAVRLVKEKMPNLVLLDIILSGMDGYEVLKILKTGEETKKIPVILFTNLGSQEEMDYAQSLGADGFLIKAHNSLDDIVKKVREFI